MEQILVYKDPAFDKEEKKYKWVQQELQNLVNGLKRIGITPTDENIKKLLKGESLVSEMAENMINAGFSQLPRKAKIILPICLRKNRMRTIIRRSANWLQNWQHLRQVEQVLLTLIIFTLTMGLLLFRLNTLTI